MILDAFRQRTDETGAVTQTESLRDLLSFREPTDSVAAAIRRAQYEALVRLIPATVVSQVLAAGLVAISLRGTVADVWLALWFGAILSISAARGARALRLRSNPVYAANNPPKLKIILILISVVALLWMVPALFWFQLMGVEHQLMTGVLLVALMSAGTVSLGSVPQAVLVYLGILLAGGLVMTSQFSQSVHMVLLVILSVSLGFAGIANARRFIGHVRAQLELREQSELITLLREFEASGSDWLWEVDEKGRMRYMSPAMAEAAGWPLAELVGVPATAILDPDGKAAELSAGIRAVAEHAARREPFKDIAVPMHHGRRWWSLSGKPLIDGSGRFYGWRGVGSDITDIRLSGKDAVRSARLDPLTGVANRLMLREQLEEALLRQLGGGSECALLLVDLDRFKLVNDTLGHSIGDELLCEIARRLEKCVGHGGVVGRLGGDEFAIVWRGRNDDSALGELASVIISEVSRSVNIGAATLHVGATIGIARAPQDGEREERLMRCADLALYRGKEQGRGGYAFFEPQMFAEAEDYRSLENDLRNALTTGGLELYYQPIVDAVTGETVGREALLRWTHPERGAIPPDQFVPIIEDAGLIHQIGDWVVRESCFEAAAWPDEARVAVNISAAQFSGNGLLESVVSSLSASGLPADRLELEVTESIFISDDAATLTALESLRGIGVRLVLDDFGKGYSSFGYLTRARFAKIKIDRSFVQGAAEGERHCTAIVRAILALARGLGIDATAEGVETPREAEVMQQLGCNQLQGFLFGRPAPAIVSPDTDERRRA